MDKIPYSLITLRPLEITDTYTAVKWLTDEKVHTFLPWDAFATEIDAVIYFVKHGVQHPWHKAICVAGRVVGSVCVSPMEGGDRCRAEIGYVVAPEYWGRGVATRAVEMAADAVFSEWAHLERLEALVDVGNTASQRVLEKVGFKREGVLRRYSLLRGKSRDVVIFSLLSTDNITRF